jgi:nitrate reductase alpha subunit
VARGAGLLPPVAAWASIQADPAKRKSYTAIRGHGGFVRSTWDEVNEIIAAANAYTAKKWGPDRVIGFSPIPAMSMVSYAAGSRYLSLLGGTCMSFYDWYCDLPPASPMTWGEQTDVPESADWYNAGFLMLWGSNVPQTRTPDAHFMTEARYRGAKVAVVSPDYAEATKFADIVAQPQGRAPTRRWPWRWAMSSCASSISTGRCPISRIIAAAIPTCRCWSGWSKRTAVRA